eukprot:CAMPEP_0204074678 /NCGR_PEP_ID=MMETSP0360-20130528/165139_1 /ASSEMBLY_ACC=CAM_ASM_000342 /TAXON_ID=268821 /ORGANISM="Scrippsiella Hangoei, Strain SHTV-5" /LENGTH=87 /DNA_ID=CAMNT_0051023139 /DNA_START=545 /DNA_END=804 /DNA_ORIENTATION=-
MLDRPCPDSATRSNYPHIVQSSAIAGLVQILADWAAHSRHQARQKLQRDPVQGHRQGRREVLGLPTRSGSRRQRALRSPARLLGKPT